MLRELRSGGCRTPVLLLTAKAEVEDRILGLDMGADDYLPKPFAMGELLARVRAMLRRGEVYTPDVLSFGDLELDRGGSLLSSVSGSVTLTRLEYRMLEALMLNRGIYLSTEELLVKVWGYESEAEQGPCGSTYPICAGVWPPWVPGCAYRSSAEWATGWRLRMLKTLRRKFVVTTMAGVTLLLLVLLGGINGVNVWLSSRDTDMRLLTLARLDEGGAARPEAAELELSQLIEDAAAQFAEPAEAAGLGLKTEIEPGLKLRGVPETVTELAGILLDNAVKYSAPGSVISLRLVREGGRSVLSVRNRCEERPREPERLFDRFYRGDAARTQSSGGSGLGLAIARALAENLHGSMSVETPGETDLEFVARFP